MEIYLKAKSLTLSSVAIRKLFWSQISQGSWPVSFKCIDEPPILIFCCCSLGEALTII